MTPQGPPCRSRSGAAGGKHAASRAPPAAAPWRLIKGTMRHAARGRARAIRRRVRGVGRRVVAAISSTRRRRCIRSAPRPAERSGGDRSARSAGELETIRFNRGDRIQGLARVPSCERRSVVYCRGRNPRRGRTRPRRLTNGHPRPRHRVALFVWRRRLAGLQAAGQRGARVAISLRTTSVSTSYQVCTSSADPIRRRTAGRAYDLFDGASTSLEHQNSSLSAGGAASPDGGVARRCGANSLPPYASVAARSSSSCPSSPVSSRSVPSLSRASPQR